MHRTSKVVFCLHRQAQGLHILGMSASAIHKMCSLVQAAHAFDKQALACAQAACQICAPQGIWNLYFIYVLHQARGRSLQPRRLQSLCQLRQWWRAAWLPL